MEKNYKAELVGVFGSPIEENPTGVIEETAFAAKELNYRYIMYRVEKEGLGTAMASVRALGMRGINLTIPHKVEAVQYLDQLSEAAEIIGAVNLVVNDDGVLWGDNTDGKGFMSALKSEGETPEGKYVTILGAGGAARAISVECALNGARHIHVVNIEREQGETLAKLLDERTPATASFSLWNGAFPVPPETDILINATSVGLYPNTDQKPEIDYDTISSNMVICDVIFNDPHTLFLQEAEKRGAKTVNGLGMLANQAALNFTAWTGVEAPLELMKQTLKKEFGLK